MDHEFRSNEMGTDPEDAKYENWMAQVRTLLGRDIAMGSQEESDLFDYYNDKASPKEAVDDFLITEAVKAREENGGTRSVQIVGRNGAINNLTIKR
jgi:hypothetical protein